MEDEVGVIDEGPQGKLYAGVFDGHGGDAAAIWLSDNLSGYVDRALSEKGDDPKAALVSAFESADRDLLAYLEEQGGSVMTGAGATASVVLVDAETVTVANLGDSSAIISRSGRFEELSTPHRVYGPHPAAARETARVEAGGGWVADCRVCDVLAVSRAFGDWEFKGKGLARLLSDGVGYEWWDQEWADGVVFTADPVIATPDVCIAPLSAEGGDEFIVIATDGLWDFYPSTEAMRHARSSLKNGHSAQEVAEELVDRALKRYTSDNVGIVVIKMPWAFQPLPGSKAAKAPRKKRFGMF